MPFKSQQQRKWMFAVDPKMAKRWAKHTPKGKKLPRKVSEMPHFDSDTRVKGKEIGVVDLRIERYPMPKGGKERLMQDFIKSGLVGEKDGQWLHFKNDYTIQAISQQQAESIPKLPDDWEEHAEFVSMEAFIGDTHISDDSEAMLEPAAISEEMSIMNLYEAKLPLHWTKKTSQYGDEWVAKTRHGNYVAYDDDQYGANWQFQPSDGSLEPIEITDIDGGLDAAKKAAEKHWDDLQTKAQYDEPLNYPGDIAWTTASRKKGKAGHYARRAGGTLHGQRVDYLPPDLNSVQRPHSIVNVFRRKKNGSP